MDAPTSSEGSGAVLTDNGRGEEYRTLQIVERAVREGWPVPESIRPKVINRLFEITQRPSVEVLTKAGPFDSVADADRNATAAASVLVRMTGENQTERHHSDKLAQDDKHLAIDRGRVLMGQLARRYHEQGKPVPPMLREYLPADCRP